MLTTSMATYGVTVPLIVDEDDWILKGHGCLEAAKRLGLTSVPTRVLFGLTNAQKRAYVIADNKAGELSRWDTTLLKSEMEILIQQEFDIEVTGFSTAEIDIMFDESQNSAPSDPDELQAEDIAVDVVSRPGDLWQAGKHFLLNGNALYAACYEIVMQGQLAQMVITDAPYNVPINGHVCGKGKKKHQEFVMASGEMSQQEFTGFLSTAMGHLHNFSKDGSIHYFFMDWRHMREMLDAAEPLFGSLRQLCPWIKDNGGMGSFYRSQHELVFVFKKGDAPHINNFELGQHGRYRTNVWIYPGANSFSGNGHELLVSHPTPKPVSLVADAIRDCSHRKGIVLDPFCGSGTILIAAERTGRHARAIELDPIYVDTAIRRWQRVTGREAVLAATGQTWEQVGAERLSGKDEGGRHGL
jgi:DNA modification methylase